MSSYSYRYTYAYMSQLDRGSYPTRRPSMHNENISYSTELPNSYIPSNDYTCICKTERTNEENILIIIINHLLLRFYK